MHLLGRVGDVECPGGEHVSICSPEKSDDSPFRCIRELIAVISVCP